MDSLAKYCETLEIRAIEILQIGKEGPPARLPNQSPSCEKLFYALGKSYDSFLKNFSCITNFILTTFPVLMINH